MLIFSFRDGHPSKKICVLLVVKIKYEINFEKIVLTKSRFSTMSEKCLDGHPSKQYIYK